MKNKIIIIAILLAPIFLSAQNGSMRQNGPEIVFDETIFDFDTIAQNGSGEHVFYFTNKGSEPLIITSAFSSCGCVDNILHTPDVATLLIEDEGLYTVTITS